MCKQKNGHWTHPAKISSGRLHLNCLFHNVLWNGPRVQASVNSRPPACFFFYSPALCNHSFQCCDRHRFTIAAYASSTPAILCSRIFSFHTFSVDSPLYVDFRRMGACQISRSPQPPERVEEKYSLEPSPDTSGHPSYAVLLTSGPRLTRHPRDGLDLYGWSSLRIDMVLLFLVVAATFSARRDPVLFSCFQRSTVSW